MVWYGKHCNKLFHHPHFHLFHYLVLLVAYFIIRDRTVSLSTVHYTMFCVQSSSVKPMMHEIPNSCWSVKWLDTCSLISGRGRNFLPPCPEWLWDSKAVVPRTGMPYAVVVCCLRYWDHFSSLPFILGKGLTDLHCLFCRILNAVLWSERCSHLLLMCGRRFIWCWCTGEELELLDKLQ
jgi:hypothetical protein